MAEAIAEPPSSRYCLQAATAPFRQAAAAWVEQRFGVSVDPEREILLLVGSQEGTPICRWRCSIPVIRLWCWIPATPAMPAGWRWPPVSWCVCRCLRIRVAPSF